MAQNWPSVRSAARAPRVITDKPESDDDLSGPVEVEKEAGFFGRASGRELGRSSATEYDASAFWQLVNRLATRRAS